MAKKQLTVYPAESVARLLGGSSSPRYNLALVAFAHLIGETAERRDAFSDSEWKQFLQLLEDHEIGETLHVRDRLIGYATVRGFVGLAVVLRGLDDLEVWKLIFTKGTIKGERS